MDLLSLLFFDPFGEVLMGYLEQTETYAPIRKVAEQLGYTVKWDELKFLVDLQGEARDQG
jgi:hypothetical protein